MTHAARYLERVPPSPPIPRLHVTEADSEIGTRVSDALAQRGVQLVGLDEQPEIVVHLGAADYEQLAQRRRSLTEGAMAVLEAADQGAARHIVFVSSALVYGAFDNNPVPLTEDAVVRPDVEFVFARQLSTAEANLDRWRTSRPGRSATVLRPVVTMSADGTSALGRALAAGMGERRGEDVPPTQFLHLDDLVSAVELAAMGRLDGVYNVAPDGWISGERLLALTGAPPRLHLPDRVAEVLGNLRWRLQRGPIPPGLRSYTRAPWVVANDRLVAAGWTPRITNEQAYVEGTESRWWMNITPKRRQELALGAMVAAAVGAVAAVGITLIRRRRRRR